MVKNIINSTLKALGYKLVKLNKKNTGHISSHYVSHHNAIKRVIPYISLPATIIDVGAAKGEWSLSIESFFPQADFLLFEPLEERKIQLENLCKSKSSFHFVPYAAGNLNETVKFRISDDLDGSGVADEGDTEKVQTFEVRSISSELSRFNLKGPYIVKLDTHGYELPILEGCADILTEVELFIIECYGFRLTKQSPLFYELCKYMDSIGFRLFDVIDFLRRPVDNAFWQCDAIFLRSDSKVFNYNTYQ